MRLSFFPIRKYQTSSRKNNNDNISHIHIFRDIRFHLIHINFHTFESTFNRKKWRKMEFHFLFLTTSIFVRCSFSFLPTPNDFFLTEDEHETRRRGEGRRKSFATMKNSSNNFFIFSANKVPNEGRSDNFEKVTWRW